MFFTFWAFTFVQYLVTGSRATLLSLCACRIALPVAPCSVWYIARATLLSLCACWIARGAMLILILLARPSHHFVLVVLSRCGAGLISTSFSRPSRHYVHVGSLLLWGALRCFTQVLLRNRFYTQKASTRRIFLRARAFTQKCLHTGAFTHRSFDA